MGRAWASGAWWDGGRPSPADDARHRRWWARYLRMAASPAMAQNVIRMNMRMDIRDLLPTVDRPTLILHRAGDTWIDVGHARYLAEHIPGARYVELPGSDHRPWLGDVDAIAEHVLGGCERFFRPGYLNHLVASCIVRSRATEAWPAAAGGSALALPGSQFEAY